jgi:hypothetical protein
MTQASNAVIFIGLMWAVSATHAAPLPPEKPLEFREQSRNSAAPQTLPGNSPTSSPGAGKLTAAPVVDACVVGLGAMGVKAHEVSASLSESDACIVATPIRIEQVTDQYGRGSPVRFTNEPLIDCQLAEPLAHWLGEVVAPVIAANFSSPLKAIRTGPGYECRNRNHERKARSARTRSEWRLTYPALNCPMDESCHSAPETIWFRKRFCAPSAQPHAAGFRLFWDRAPTRRTRIICTSIFKSTVRAVIIESVNKRATKESSADKNAAFCQYTSY